VDYSKKRKLVEEEDEEDEDVVDQRAVTKAKKEEVQFESNLDPEIKRLMELICDLKTMEMEIRHMEYDVNKSPLGNLGFLLNILAFRTYFNLFSGKITKAQIKAGYEALSQIESHIKSGIFDASFTEAVDAYYTRIPHSFGYCLSCLFAC
jgi:poly [ADP-ribose] polymerase